MAELRLKFTGDPEGAKRASAEVRATVIEDLARIRAAAARSFATVAGQVAKARAGLAGKTAAVGDAEGVKQYNERLVQTRETLVKLQAAVREARQEIAGSAQETATSTRRFEVLEQTIQTLTARADELQGALERGVTPQAARQVDALNAAAERTNNTFLNTQARLKDVAAGSDALSVVVEEIRRLGEIIKGLEPGRLHSLVNVLGNLGHAAQGLAAIKELGVTVEHITRASIAVRGAVTSTAEGAQTLYVAAKDKAAAGIASVSESVSGLTARLPAMLSGLGGGGAGLLAVGAAAAVVVGALALVTVGVIALVAAFAALAVAVPVAVDLLQRIFEKGIPYNSQLEQTRLGIAAVVASLADLETAQGKKLEGPQALNAALALAQDQLQKLKVDAVNTTATFEQIAPAFQAAIGPGVRAGLTLDQIRQTVVRITQAAGAVGVPFAQLNQEVRAILEGTINEDARLAKILGISNEMVKNWKAQGTLAEELNKRLEQFGAAGVKAAETLDGLKSNLQESLNVFTGEATQRAFGVLKDRIARLLPQLFDFKVAGIDKSFKVLAEIIDDIFVRVINVAGDVVEQVIAGVKNVAGFLSENRGLVDAILQTAEDILRVIIQFARQLLSSVSNTRDWRGLLELTLGTLQVIKVVLQSFAPIIRDASFAAGILLSALVAASPMLRVIGAFSAAAPKSAAETAATVAQQASEALGVLESALVKVKARPSAPGKGKSDNKAHQEAVRRLEQEEREIEEVYKRQTEALKREFDQQLTSSRTFTQGIVDAAEERFKGLQAVYQKELAVAKKQSEIDKVNNDLKKAEGERDKAVQEARDAQNKREAEALRRHRENLLDLQDEYDELAIDSIRRRAEMEAVSEEEAEEKVFQIQTDAFNRRLQAARDDEAAFYAQQKDINDANVELAREYSDRIAALVAQQERAQAEHDARMEAARQKDLERRREYQDKVFGLQKTYEEQDRDAKQKEVERGLRSPSSATRVQAISARLELEIGEINRRERLTEKRLKDDEAAAKRDFERRNRNIKGTKDYYDSLLLIEQNYEALRKQNQDQADQERRDATGRANVGAENESPLSVRSLFGDEFADRVNEIKEAATAAGETISTLRAEVGALIDQLRDDTNFGVLELFAQSIVTLFSGLRDAVLGAVDAIIFSGATLKGALAAAFKDALAQTAAFLSKKALMKALEAFAEAAMHAAALDFAGAARYAAAGAAWTALAAAVAVGGRAVAGTGNKGTATAGAGGGPGAVYEQQARNREFRYGGSDSDASDELSGGARASGRGVYGRVVAEALNAARDAHRQNAAMAAQLEATLSRFSTMSPGVLVAEGAPGASAEIGAAVLTQSSSDNDFNDQMLTNFGFRR